jgi:RNA polymerase sigma-70 factor (ECF subfamily)
VCREVLEADLVTFEYRGEAAFRNWLFTRTLNKLRNRERYYFAGKRDARRTIRVAQPEVRDGLARLYAAIATPSQNAVAAEAVEQLEAAFARLAEEDRQILSMSRIVGLSCAEIAAELDMKEGTVRVRLHRALARVGTIMHVADSEPRE